MITNLFKNLLLMAVFFAIMCVVFYLGWEYYAFWTTIAIYSAYYFWKDEMKKKLKN